MESFYKPKEKVYVEGRLRGYVNGDIDAIVHGTITGDVKPISENFDKVDEELIEEMEGIDHEKK